MKKRKPVIRLFLLKNYATISAILFAIAGFILIGIAGWVIDINGTIIPSVHIPLFITALVSGLLGFGLNWIYDEN